MFEKITDRIFAFISRNEGSNSYLIRGDKEIALVDTGLPSNRSALLGSLSGLGLNKDDVTMILHTHGHADHFGLDNVFSNARVALSEADALYLEKKDREFACLGFFPGVQIPKISIKLKSNGLVDLGGISLNAIPTPGHTAGGLCFFFEPEGILFSGDVLFGNGFGRVDLPTGQAAKMHSSLAKLEKMPIKVLLPGHGPVLQGLEENRQNIKAALAALGPCFP